MELHELNTALVAETILAQIAQTEGLSPQTALLANPSQKAVFPCAVASEILARQKYGGWSYDISLRVEVWAQDIYAAMRMSDLVRIQLAELGIRQSGTMPELYDEITDKARYGMYYGCRWNAILNTFEPNR